MPAPSTADFDRLRALCAIGDIDARPSRQIYEIFTGKELTTIPAAPPRTSPPPSRRRGPPSARGPRARSANAPPSWSGSAAW